MSIKEIAKRANVSPATVSRVLNNPDYNCSSPEVRERIRKAAMELNYVPNEAARRLKQGKNEKTEKTYYLRFLCLLLLNVFIYPITLPVLLISAHSSDHTKPSFLFLY